MTSGRLRVSKTTRSELRDMQKPGETYTDVLHNILPDKVNDDTIITSDEMVVISVESDLSKMVNQLAGDGVSAHELIDYYLFKQKLEKTLPAEAMLEQMYNRGNLNSRRNISDENQ
jgi:hypothetical protein